MRTIREQYKSLFSAESGMSMTSFMLFLGGAGIMLSLIFSFWDDIQSTLNTFGVRQEVSTGLQNVQSLYEGQGDFQGIDNETIIGAKAVPSSLNVSPSDNTIEHSWDGEVNYESRNSGSQFAMVYNNIPQGACVDAATLNLDIFAVEVNSTTINDPPVDVSTATSNCNDDSNNSVAFLGDNQ